MQRRTRDPYPPTPPEGSSRYEEPLNPRQRAPGYDGREGSPLVLILVVLIVVLLVLLAGGGYWLFFHRGGGEFAGSAGGATAPPPAIVNSVGGAQLPGSVVLDLATIKTAAGNAVSSGPDGHTAVIASTQQSPNAHGTTGGAYFAVEPAISQALSGHTVVIRVTARAAAVNPSTRFALAFSGNGLGDTGWITFVPTADFQVYSVRIALPAAVGPTDHVGIWADVFGLGKALEVSKVEIVPLP